MSNKLAKTHAFKKRYVTFSSSGVHVDLDSFLATKEGQELIRKATASHGGGDVAPAGMVLKVEALVLQMDDEARAEYDRCIREKAGEEEFAAAVATQNAVNRIGRLLGVLVDAAPTPEPPK